ncbi:hypothetical protein A0130_14580 [Leifsonia xyli]|uniref:ASCH domain-containing protein n=1 Tax=Leifsonia xyli TaxID=1575 RepID=UPI0007CDF1ED|nr:hypothetical protein A0130_14580 [Leifsonia xyli]
MSTNLEPASHTLLPVALIGTAGPQRDRLTKLVLAGTKTATSSLLSEWISEAEPLPRIGSMYQLVDSEGDTIAILEIIGVATSRFDQVDDQHARDKGEGDTTAAQWRVSHHREWPDITDDTTIVLSTSGSSPSHDSPRRSGSRESRFLDRGPARKKEEPPPPDGP